MANKLNNGGKEWIKTFVCYSHFLELIIYGIHLRQKQARKERVIVSIFNYSVENSYSEKVQTLNKKN